MDKRSGRNSSKGTGRRTVKKNPSSTTKKVSAVSDETKMYKFNKDDLDDAINDAYNRKDKNGKKLNNKANTKKKKVFKIIKKIILVLFILGLLAGLILAGIIAGIFFGFFGDDFKMTKDDLLIQFSNSEVYDSAGNLICTLVGDESRKIVSLEDMPKYLPKAYVSIEDERFYQHNGVDIKRTGAATITYLFKGDSSYGGSSITQQLVKNITKDDDHSALRKVKEMARAIQIEKEISKDDILELYLNVIYVGGKGNLHGVALASEYYFNKNVSDLSLAECAFLAGINHSPNSYDPFKGSDETVQKCNNRAKVVLNKMYELGNITQEEYNTASAEIDAGLKFEQGNKNATVVYSSLTEAAIDQIVKQMMDEKGMTRQMAETRVYGGGYKIYTTEVPSIQSTLEEEMKKDKYIKNGKKKDNDGNVQKSQAAMVIIEPSTGYVVGCVGQLGEKTKNGDLNRAVQSYRQVGSAMKPLAVITPAIQEGIITPCSVYLDKQTSEFLGKPWPKNYDGRYRGKQTVRQAIAVSGNVIPVRILNQLGVDKSMEYLNRMGLTINDSNIGLSLALGAKEYSPLQIAAGYAMIGNDGLYIEPSFYSKVLDSSGNVALEPHQKKDQIMGKGEAYQVKSILMEPVIGTTSGATATYAKMSGFDVCAKTGTTNDDFDRWFCEITPYYAAACWYGYDINEEVHYSGSPSNPAGGICTAVMKAIHKGLEAKKFTVPDDIVTLTVCKDSGLLPSPGCPTITDIFVKSRVPTEYCSTESSVKTYLICEDSGLIAIEGACPNVVEKTFDVDEELPTEVCGIHKVQPSETPTPTPTSTPTASKSPKPTQTARPTKTPTSTPSTTPNPSEEPEEPED